jgi:hypothetical protein
MVALAAPAVLPIHRAHEVADDYSRLTHVPVGHCHRVHPRVVACGRITVKLLLHPTAVLAYADHLPTLTEPLR